ncbi:MAG: N-acetylgalactosamine-4-sulfatase [Planctomycetes bacterium RBG_16_55_9]|nr:MAG: N-acetylgalactosamine-4-sulfatase [Planctomycetes bacterium RBG_16_55_9]
MTDDQGYGDLACHGNPTIKTSNLDKLYAQSVRLTNFHVAPTCSPTRAGLMTGRYCNRTGVWHTIMGRSILRKDEVTMGDVFSAGGYRTGIFGKWHLGDNYPFRPQDRGFGEVLIHLGGGVGQGPDYWGNDYFDDTYFHNGEPEKFTGYYTNVWFNGAMKFIEANKDRPFFCYIPTNAAHGPYYVAAEYMKPYVDKGLPESLARFYGMITNIDDNVARLMRRLKDLDLEENTILIYMTDNGSSGNGYNAGMRGKKGSEYDGGHRVPCFIRWPAGYLKGGRDIDRLTAHVDLLPTLIELCGLKKPDGVKFDGESIVRLLTDNDGSWPDHTLVTDSQRIEHPEKWRKSAVMTDRWRLINGKELYDMKADPAQKKDVADANSQVVERLRKAYEDWWADVSARFDEYSEIVIGSDKQNPTRLMSHDWHGPDVPWDQRAVRNGMEANGFWAVEIERDGTYQFELRRWPEEADAPINAAIPGGKAISATKARLKVANVDETKPIPMDARAITFEVRLKAGKTRLQTWFMDDEGTSRGAYYVYSKRL